MKKSEFIEKLDHAAIETAIEQAERRTSGEIRVVVAHREAPDAVATAKEQFVKLGMAQTRERNGVLIFIAPVSQTYAVIGDEAIHLKCGAAFWTEMAEVIGGHFKAGKFNDGLRHGIAKAGALLGEHFPRRDNDRDELSNRVEVV